MPKVPVDYREAIADASENLRLLNGEIARMPAFKRTTPFGEQRLRAKQRLLAQLASLCELQRKLEAEMN